MQKQFSPEYRQYMGSPQWQGVRQDAFRRYGRRCAGCMYADSIHMHHLFYPADITQTTEDHILPLCHRCHEIVHEQQHFFHPTVFDAADCGAKRRETIVYLQGRRERAASHARHCRSKHTTPAAVRAERLAKQLIRLQPLRERRAKAHVFMSAAEYQAFTARAAGFD